MKKVITIIAIVALIGLLGGLMIARVPNDYSETVKILEEEGYQVRVDENDEKMVFVFKVTKVNNDGKYYEATEEVRVSNLVEAVGDGKDIVLYYFENVKDADRCYSTIKNENEGKKVGLVNNLVYAGTEQAIEDIAQSSTWELKIPLGKDNKNDQPEGEEEK